MRTTWKIIFSLAVSALASCHVDSHLRGSVQPSSDGKTYLLVAEGNNCDSIKVDGKSWDYPIGVAGEINPGVHIINCNGEIEFRIPEKVVFKFDYWGP